MLKLERKTSVARKKPKADSKWPLGFITRYSNVLPNINNVLQKYYRILSKDKCLIKAFPEEPRVTCWHNLT